MMEIEENKKIILFSINLTDNGGYYGKVIKVVHVHDGYWIFGVLDDRIFELASERVSVQRL